LNAALNGCTSILEGAAVVIRGLESKKLISVIDKIGTKIDEELDRLLRPRTDIVNREQGEAVLALGSRIEVSSSPPKGSFFPNVAEALNAKGLTSESSGR
jgi:hypothetical protein